MAGRDQPAQPQPAPAQVIQAYGNGGFTTSGIRHHGSIAVLRDRTISWTPPPDLARLAIDDFQIVLAAGDVDLVLLGCGMRAVSFNPDLRLALRQRGLAVETMDTGAACRTFNVLQMEGRRVAAMLIALP